MADLDEQTIADLKSKHGNELMGVEALDGTILVFRKPKRQEYDLWAEKQTENRTVASRQIAQQCIVYPDAPAMFGVIDKEPGILQRKNGIIDAITELAGVTADPAPKKKL